MEAALQRELATAWLRPTGHSGGGCISQGQSYDTDRGRVFVKSNSKAEANVGHQLPALKGNRVFCGIDFLCHHLQSRARITVGGLALLSGTSG